ncbi:MAG: cadmium-translocating P-type ATPase [Desulfurococcales archaeon]|nr:cadmium-translocating P-type ATPase [Desulfurococcales archaeon]
MSSGIGNEEQRVLWYALLIGGAVIALSTRLGYRGISEALLLLVSVLLAARFSYAILTKRFTVDLLMSVAGLVLLRHGLVLEGGIVMALYGLAELSEEYAERYAIRKLEGLRKLIPRKALVERNGGLYEVSAEELRPGDIVVVRKGEAVPVDIRLVSRGVFDLSHVTGEPEPVEALPGVEVPSGAINLGNPVKGIAIREPSSSFMQRLVREALEAAERKASIQRLLERIAPHITLGVLAVFAATHLVLGGVRAVSILLAGCPSAFIVTSGYSTALSIALLASRGVVVKGGQVLEASAKVRVVLLDKTGTVTTTRHRVARVQPPPGISEERFLALVSSLAAASLHPLSRALATIAQDRLPVSHVKETPGLGIEGVVDGARVFIGRVEGDAPECPRGLKTIHARVEGGIGAICLEEVVDPSAPRAVAEIKSMGLRIVLASGDQVERVARIARVLGVDEYYGGLKPEDKARLVEEYRRRAGPVAFAGDGINDLVAIAGADVGIAVGSIEAATGVADAVSPGGALGVARLLKASRSFQRALVYSFTLATLVKVAAAIGGLAGVLDPIIVALVGDDGSTMASIALATLMLAHLHKRP